MCSGAGHTTWLVRGSPIRTSSDQRSVGSSPRLLAASHVLHRLLVPRHPPCALNNLTTQKPHPHPPALHPKAENPASPGGPITKLSTESEDARVHCAVLNVRPATAPTPPPDPTPPAGGMDGTETGTALSEGPRSPAPSGPNSVPTTPRPPTTPIHTPPRSTNGPAKSSTGSRRAPAAELVSVPPSSTTPDTPRHLRNWRRRHGPGAALHHQDTGPGGQRSLERR